MVISKGVYSTAARLPTVSVSTFGMLEAAGLYRQKQLKHEILQLLEKIMNTM